MSTSIAKAANKNHNFFDENPRKSRRFRSGFTMLIRNLEIFIESAADRDLYRALLDTANPLTRISRASIPELAEKRGRRDRTIQYGADRLQRAGVVVKREHKCGRRSNRTNEWFLPVLNEEFLRRRTAENFTVKQPLDFKTKTTPLPPKGGGETPAPRVDRPIPSAELHRALQDARELRSQRRAERRQRRYQAAREGRQRRREEPNPVQRSVRAAMAALNVCPSLWGTRLAIQTSIERWMKERGVEAEHAVSPLVARWKDYAWDRHLLEYPCGMKTFFGECRWLNGELEKSDLRSLRLRSAAAVGVYRPPARPVDLEALKAKMAALLGDNWDMEDQDEGPDRERFEGRR